MKHRIALLGVVASVATALVAVGGALAARDMATPTQKVTVTMTDFKFKLSKTALKPGKTTFTVLNKGKSIHDFDITKVKNMPFIAPGKSFKYTVTLKKGTWAFVCTVPRHIQLGMVGKFTAK